MNACIRPISRTAILIAVVTLLLLPAAVARAGTGGNEDIYGDVFSSPHYYYFYRTINIPSSSGPDIAALKYAGPTGMKLGSHNCGGSPLAAAQVINQNFYVGLVGDRTTVHNQIFCLFTQKGSTGSTGSFTANLDWD